MRPIYSTLASKTRGLCPVGYSSAISLLPTRLAPFDGGSHASRGGSCSALRECSQNTDDCSNSGGTASPGQRSDSSRHCGPESVICRASHLSLLRLRRRHSATLLHRPIRPRRRLQSITTATQTDSFSYDSLERLAEVESTPSDGLSYQQLFLYSGVVDSIGAVAAVVKKAPTSPPSPVPRGRRDSRSG